MTGVRPPANSDMPAEPRRGQLARLIGGSLFVFACRLGGAGLTFASQVLMARWMGAKEFGIYVISFSWCILLSTCATAGMAQGAIRFVGKGLATGNLAYVRGFVRRGFQVSAIGGLVTAAVGSVIVLMVRDIVPAAGRMAMLMSMATVPFFAVLNYFGGAANAFPWLAQSFLGANVVRPLLFLAALWALAQEQQHYTATAAMVLQWFSFVIVAVLAGWLFQYRLAREVPTTAREYETRQWLRVAVPLLGVSIFNAYLPEITVVISSFYMSTAEVGVLQVSYRIALLIAFGLFAVDSITAPEAARLVARTEQADLQKTTDRATRLRFWPALAAVIVLALAGRRILAIFGPEFVSGYAVLVILASAQLTTAAVGPVMRLMMLSGHMDRSLLASVGSLLLLPLLLAALAPRYGAVGAATAALIDMAVWSLWMRYLVVKTLDIRPSII